MTLDFYKFLNTAAYLYITDPEFQPIADAAGIKWESHKRDSLGAEMVSVYTTARAGGDHDVGLFAVQHNLQFLFDISDDFTKIPNKVNVLAHRYANYTKAESFEALGKKLMENPEAGEKLLEEFQITNASGVDHLDVAELVANEHINLTKEIQAGTALVTVPGFQMLSEMIGGFNRGRLIMVTGDTGFGKTNWAINLCLRASEKMFTAYANMEMSYKDISKRFMVIGTRTSYTDVFAGRLALDSLKSFMSRLIGRMVVTDGRTLSLPQIEAWIRIIKAKQPDLGLVVIDYDQKIDLPSSREEQEWKSVQRAIIKLEDLAKELNFCCIVMAQLNREGDISSSHRATFTAHTVLNFRDDPPNGALIQAKKNRHGKKNQALRVNYDESNSQISEVEVITVTADKPEKRLTFKPRRYS